MCLTRSMITSTCKCYLCRLYKVFHFFLDNEDELWIFASSKVHGLTGEVLQDGVKSFTLDVLAVKRYLATQKRHETEATKTANKDFDARLLETPAIDELVPSAVVSPAPSTSSAVQDQQQPAILNIDPNPFSWEEVSQRLRKSLVTEGIISL